MGQSPVMVKPVVVTMDFSEAIKAVANGRKITKLEWGSTKIYGVLIADVLHICYPEGHETAGTHRWNLSYGDIIGTDYMIV